MPTKKPSTPRVAVIGAGLGGLAAAVRLAHAGLSVVVFEKNERPGGKIGVIEEAGYRWETGPTLLTLPHVLRALWRDIGRPIAEDLEIVPLEPACRYWWPDGLVMDEDAAFWRRSEVARFMEYARGLYELADAFFLHQPVHDWPRALNVANLKTLRHLARALSRQSAHAVAAAHFSDQRLVQIFDQFILMNGSSPFFTPPAFHFHAYAHARYGAWHVKGGMHRVVEALTRIAHQLNVELRLGHEVTGLDLGRAGFSIAIDGTWERFDCVVCDADTIQAYQTLMPRGIASRFRVTKIERLPLSCSAFTLHLGVTRQFDGIAPRNIFFSADPAGESNDLFKRRTPCMDPTILLTVSSRLEAGNAPEGCDNWFVQVAAPATRKSYDWRANADAWGDVIIAKLAARFPGLEQAICVRLQHSPLDFRNQFNTYAGNLYGFAAHSLQAAFLRPRIDPRELPGLVFTGSSAHPGGSVAQVLNGARIAAEKILAFKGRS